jgi:hypothetical protein
MFLSVLLCSNVKTSPLCELDVLGVTKNKSKCIRFSLLTNTFLVVFGTQGLGAWYDNPTDESVPARA